MTSEVLRHRLKCLGWKPLDGECHRESGRWRLFVYSCGHTIVALADSRRGAWSAAYLMAMKLTRNGLMRRD